MGSPSLMIILILVVWIIVLAPLMIGNNKPIRRSGDGYDETRVLHEGGTAPMAERRRPKLTAADIHRSLGALPDALDQQEAALVLDDGGDCDMGGEAHCVKTSAGGGKLSAARAVKEQSGAELLGLKAPSRGIL